jgi:hypothetical protein
VTRREFLSIWPSALAARVGPIAPVIVPVRAIVDTRVNWHLDLLRRFWWRIWPDAVRSFGRCGIQLQATEGHGDVARPPGREPIVSGLDPHSLNLVLTNRIPMEWDSGRDLSGVTLRYWGYHLCMLALSRAHGNQIPYLSVNTCVHEMLHALLFDIFESRPSALAGQWREFRVDACATRLWLCHSGGALRESARRYAERLRAETIPPDKPE